MIREACINDIPSIFSLEQSSFARPYSFESLSDDLNNEKIKMFVKIDSENIVAYISVYYFLDEANLQRIAVLEKERHKGVAGQLISYSIEFLKSNGVKSYYLEVNENNKIALSLYEKNGFEKVSTRKNYYGLDTAIIYQKRL